VNHVAWVSELRAGSFGFQRQPSNAQPEFNIY
jgi:hypothetical protein